MGKRLIIKGSDFSENGIQYVVQYTPLFGIDVANANTNGATINDAVRQFLLPSYALSAMAGKTIYGIRLKVMTAGTFGVSKIKGLTTDPTQGDTIPGSVTITDVADLTASETGVQDLFFDSPITLGSDEMLGIKFNKSTEGADGGLVKYGNGSSYPLKISINNGSSTYNSVSTSSSSYNWGIDFLVIE